MSVELGWRQGKRSKLYLLAVLALCIFLSLFFYKYWNSTAIYHEAGDTGLSDYDSFFDWRLESPTKFFQLDLRRLFTFGHLDPLIYAFLPFYLLSSSYKTLLAIQIALTSLSIFLFYLLAREYLYGLESFLMTVIYATSTLTVYGIFLQVFKVDYLALPLIILTFYLTKRERYRPFLAVIIILILVKETYSIFLILFSLYLYQKGQDRKYWKTTIFVGVLALSSYLFFLFSFPQTFGDFYQTHWGLGPEQALGLALNDPASLLARFPFQVTRLPRLLPLSHFLPLLSPLTLLTALPSLMETLVQPATTFYRDELITITPIFFIALLHSVSLIKNKVNSYLEPKTVNKLIISLLLVLLVINTGYLLSERKRTRLARERGYPTINCGCPSAVNLTVNERYQNFLSLKERIPEDSAVISGRQTEVFFDEDYHFVDDINHADYIVYDRCLFNRSRGTKYCSAYWRWLNISLEQCPSCRKIGGQGYYDLYVNPDNLKR